MNFKILKLNFEKSNIHNGLVELTISLYERDFSEPLMSETTFCEIDGDMLNFMLPKFNGEYILGKIQGICSILGVDWLKEESHIVESLKMDGRVRYTYEISIEVTEYEND